ncbi:hypothetical protein GQ53DRAFT_753892 [Thozetella sp. PMI_491]|nr:hypothetical protein GQ53DRAFT_753892 [Thozetella sp. PMI_491]
MAKLSIVSLLSVALAGVASAVPLEQRWFPTCGIQNWGTRDAATSAANLVAAKGSGSFTVTSTPVILAQVTAHGVTTYVSAFAASGTQTGTYSEAASIAKTVAAGCTFLGCGTAGGDSVCFIEGTTALTSNDNLVIRVYGNYN